MEASGSRSSPSSNSACNNVRSSSRGGSVGGGSVGGGGKDMQGQGLAVVNGHVLVLMGNRLLMKSKGVVVPEVGVCDMYMMDAVH